MKSTFYTSRINSILLAALFVFTTSMAFSQVEICDNRIDDDGDGLIDCLDPDCGGDISCWDCGTEFYQVHSNSTMVELDPATGTYTTLATISGATEINGLQFNQVDGHVYAPTKINGSYTLGRLNNDGSVTDMGLALPGNGIFYAGSIDAFGTMFISNGSGVHKIDLTSTPLTLVATGVNHPGVADLALDISNGLFYGINGAADLKVFDPVTNFTSTYQLAGSINNESGAFGACWSSNDGSFFAYNNSSGKIYSVDVNNLTATLVLNGTGNLSINDGFNCVLAPPPFETNCANDNDDDGDGLVDCADPDCYSSNECTVEICDNGIDDDNDGWADCNDSECFSLAICVEICDNGIDDNGNGLIDGDDPQCSTPSGVQGGLESNRRLSDKIALRNFYTEVKNPEKFLEKKEGLIPFRPNTDSRDGLEIASLIPTELLGSTVSESAPLDLINITNATDVAAADYYLNNQRIATVLGITSEDGVYEHTKYICDRLDGSRLLDMSYLYAKGGNFTSYELLNKYGQVEYAVSFSAYRENEEFHLENHWSLANYPEGKDYYNFQIWAKSYIELIQLLEKIIDNIDEVSPITSFNNSALPKVFISYGKYENGTLKLQVRNKNLSQFINITGNLKRSESSDIETFAEMLPLTGAKDEIIFVETGHLYDMGLSMTTDDSASDEIFVADGSWGIDEQNPNAQVINFEVSPEETFYNTEEAYQVERSVSVQANIRDYLNIYRALGPKLNKTNLSQFNSLVFNAQGQGDLEITVVKQSITSWEEQFRTTISLSADNQAFILNASNLSSITGEQLVFDDVTMVVFTLLGDNLNFAPKSIELSNVRFENALVSSNDEIEFIESIIVSPNPVVDVATFSFESDIATSATLNIVDQLGRVVAFNQINIKTGTNLLEMDLSSISTGGYYFQINAGHRILNKGKLMKIEMK